jgi:hypothetical protein
MIFTTSRKGKGMAFCVAFVLCGSGLLDAPFSQKLCCVCILFFFNGVCQLKFAMVVSQWLVGYRNEIDAY